MNYKKNTNLQKLDELYESILTTSEKQGLIKEIPIFGQFYKIALASKSVSDHLFMFKLSRFIEDIDEVSNQDLTIIKNTLKNESNEEISEKLLLVVDRLDEAEKSRYIAQALNLFSIEELTKKDFLRTVDQIQKMYIGDLISFAQCNWIGNFTSHDLEKMDLSSLIGTPLMKIENIDQKDLEKDGRVDEIGITKFEDTNFGSIFRKVLNNQPPYSELEKIRLFKQK